MPIFLWFFSLLQLYQKVGFHHLFINQLLGFDSYFNYRPGCIFDVQPLQKSKSFERNHFSKYLYLITYALNLELYFLQSKLIYLIIIQRTDLFCYRTQGKSFYSVFHPVYWLLDLLKDFRKNFETLLYPFDFIQTNCSFYM